MYSVSGTVILNIKSFYVNHINGLKQKFLIRSFETFKSKLCAVNASKDVSYENYAAAAGIKTRQKTSCFNHFSVSERTDR